MPKKLILSLCAAALVAVVTVGATYAYFTADTSAANVVSIGNVNISAKLDPADTSTNVVQPGLPFHVKDVLVKNQGKTEAYIRVQLRPLNSAELQYYTDCEVLDSGGNLAALSNDLNGNWYHYRLKLAPQETLRLSGSAVLSDNVKSGTLSHGVQLQYFVEAIQTDKIESTSGGYPNWPNVEIKIYQG